MLDSAVRSEPSIGQIHIMARQHMCDRHVDLMNKLMIQNSHKKKFWIMGTARCKRKSGKTIIKPYLKAYDEQPDVRKESYLYEVDNTKGTKTLLWVMHPNDKLSLPTVGKSIRVAGESGV